MGFFEAPPPVHEPEPEPFRPEWMGPPANVLPAAAALRLLLARTPDLAVAITDASAFPTGFQLTLSLRLRHDGSTPAFDPLGSQFMGHLGGLRRAAARPSSRRSCFASGVEYRRRAQGHHDRQPVPSRRGRGGPGAASAWRWRRRAGVGSEPLGLAAASPWASYVRLRVASPRRRAHTARDRRLADPRRCRRRPDALEGIVLGRRASSDPVAMVLRSPVRLTGQDRPREHALGVADPRRLLRRSS
jgi:hypothetical protein